MTTRPTSAAAAEGMPAPTTAPAMPGTPDYAESFNSLNEPIEKAVKLGTVLRLLAEMCDDGGTAAFNDDVRCCMAIMGHEVYFALSALQDHFHDFENTHTTIELARSAARRRAA